MPHVFVKLKPGQLKSLATCIKNKQAWTLKLSKPQVMTAWIGGTETSDPKDATQPHELVLNRAQHTKFAAAHAAKRGVVLEFSKTAISQKKGGFFGAIIPALAAMAPGLLGAAPEIIDGIKQGYETVAKLVGIMPTNKESGAGLTAAQTEKVLQDALDNILQPDVLSNDTGSSLHNFGSSLYNFAPVTKKKRVSKKKASQN